MTSGTRSLFVVAAFVALAAGIGSDPVLGRQGERGKASLMDPSAAKEQAPAMFRVNFDTTKGSFVVEVERDMAPIGADRFYNLVKRGFYDDAGFYRVLPEFVEFGVPAEPEIWKIWRAARIQDDPRKMSNLRGTVALLQVAGKDRRTTRVFINKKDNVHLDKQAPFPPAPFGKVVTGMNVVDQIYGGYGEGAPTGKGPDTNRFDTGGTAYLKADFPMMDFIKTATIVP
jgi:peptidyl-prolyl cis-trans isomerase A (cyclophilin A)